MTRSIWKIPFSEDYSKFYKTTSRKSVIIPKWVGKLLFIHNGKKFNPVLIKQNMVGHKLGEFSLTKKISKYKKNK